MWFRALRSLVVMAQWWLGKRTKVARGAGAAQEIRIAKAMRLDLSVNMHAHMFMVTCISADRQHASTYGAVYKEKDLCSQVSTCGAGIQGKRSYTSMNETRSVAMGLKQFDTQLVNKNKLVFPRTFTLLAFLPTMARAAGTVKFFAVRGYHAREIAC